MCCYCVLAIIDFMYNKGIVFFEHMERDKEVKEEILLVSVAV